MTSAGSTDTCYVLSFSIIMLNTGLHNPNVRDRPPFERFVSMNRGINDGSDLPEEQLRVRTLNLIGPLGVPSQASCEVGLISTRMTEGGPQKSFRIRLWETWPAVIHTSPK